MIICKCQVSSTSAFAGGNGHWLIWSSNGLRIKELRRDIYYTNIAMMNLFTRNAAIC